MPSLIDALNAYDPGWRQNIAVNPIEAAVEIGLLEPDVLDDTVYAPLDFNEEPGQ